MKKNKEKEENKFVVLMKKRWLVNNSRTFLLVGIVVAVFLIINILMQSLALDPLDFTAEKLYTLTEESKERVKNIEQDIQIYFIGFAENEPDLDLARQYKKANERINIEAVDVAQRPDLVNKYGVEVGTRVVIIECGEKSKILSESELYSYDMTTYETISVLEPKLTTGIISVTSEKIPKVYFLQGYSELVPTTNMNILNAFLQNDINEVGSVDVMTTGKIPDDCDALIIPSPNKDFDDITTNAIIDYINQGKNILWLNAALTEQYELTNVNRVLALYGVNPFEVGLIRETNIDKMATDAPDLIIPDILNAAPTKGIYNTAGVLLINATKVNINEEQLEALNVTKTDLMNTSEGAYFRTDFNIQTAQSTSEEEKGAFLIGAELEKTIDEEKTSKLIVYGENYFVSDYQVIQNSQLAAAQLRSNKNLVMDAISYLVEREEDIEARKDTGIVTTYTATEQQDIIVKVVIFAVPIVIILVGLIVWQRRRRKR